MTKELGCSDQLINLFDSMLVGIAGIVGYCRYC